MTKKSRKRTLFEMSNLSKIEADDDVTQAYLLFKKKDYKAKRISGYMTKKGKKVGY